jgi:hypothetical protein
MELPLSWAEGVWSWANWTFVASLLVGVVATIAIVVSSNVKERYWDEERRKSAERISSNEAETEKAKADVERAHADIAKANNEAAAAKLETERLKAQAAWRRITKEQHDDIVRALASHKLDIIVNYVAADAEASQFAKELMRTLMDAGANVDDHLQIKAPPPLGIIVENSRDARSALLISVFGGVGLAVSPGDRPLNNPGNKVLLWVASKPPLF